MTEALGQGTNLFLVTVERAAGHTTEVMQQIKASLFTMTEQSQTLLPETVHWTADAILQTKNSIAEMVQRPMGAIASATDRAQVTLTETTHQAIHKLTEITHQFFGAVTADAATTQATVTEMAHPVMRSLNQMAQQAVTTIADTLEQAKTFLTDFFQLPEQLRELIGNRFPQAIADWFNGWLDGYPVSNLLVHHPWLSLGGAVLALVLLRGLLQALVDGILRLGLAILQAPVRLILWLLGFGAPIGSSAMGNKAGIARLSGKTSEQRLAEISSRIEEIKQEQDKLLQEIKSISSLQK